MENSFRPGNIRVGTAVRKLIDGGTDAKKTRIRLMFTIDKTVPINANLKSGDPILTREQVWEGLLMKAYDAKPFVHLMTKCEVTREFENGIERDIVFRGMELTERLTFHPKRKVEFVRTKGIEMGTITNEIIEDGRGDLHLRFAFSLERSDMKPGSPEEKEFAAGYAQGYLVSVQKTIDTIRELVRAGRLRIRE